MAEGKRVIWSVFWNSKLYSYSQELSQWISSSLEIMLSEPLYNDCGSSTAWLLFLATQFHLPQVHYSELVQFW